MTSEAPERIWFETQTEPQRAVLSMLAEMPQDKSHFAEYVRADATPALGAALRLPEVARLMEAANHARLAMGGYVSRYSAERKLDDALAALADLQGGEG